MSDQLIGVQGQTGQHSRKIFGTSYLNEVCVGSGLSFSNTGWRKYDYGISYAFYAYEDKSSLVSYSI